MSRWSRRTAEAMESAQRWQALATSTVDAVVAADEQGLITEWNPAAEQLFGHPAAEAIGQPLTLIVPERYRERHRRGIARLATGGAPRLIGRSTELVALRADGTEVPVEMSLGRWQHDGHAAYIAIARDVTQRKRAEDHLARYQAIVAASDQAIVSTDLEGRVTSWNPGAQVLYGWTDAEARGRSLTELVHGPELPDVRALTRTRPGAAHGEELEAQRRDQDGQPLDVGIAWSPILDVDGLPTGLVEISRDIGARKRNEAALAAATERFQVSFEHAPVGMALVGLDPARPGTLLDVNEALCRMLGRTEAELLGGRLVDVVDPEEVDPVTAAVARLASGASRSDRRETRVRRKDGTTVWVVARTQVLNDEQGRPDYAIIQVTDVTERRRAEDQLSYQALHDALTGLGNRRLFEDRVAHALARARRSDRATALLYLDLDRFKAVNDALGHDVGDQVLISVARRVQPLLRSSDTFARMGGDEFVLLLEEISAPDEADSVAARIQEELRRPTETTSGPVQVSASIGIAHVTGHESPADLIGMADAAMYEAKAAGRAQQQTFDSTVRRHAVDRRRVERDLRTAHQEHRLLLQYEAVHDVVTGRVDGFEALLRFRSRTGELVVPEQFLDHAQDAGLLDPVTAWTVGTACHDLSGWRASVPSLTVSVNVSEDQAGDDQLYRAVADAVLDHGLPPEAVAIELAEGTLPASRTLARLDQLGVRIGLDRVGTGRTPLAALRDLPLDFIKLDAELVRSVTTDPRSAALLSSVVALAHDLGLVTVALGVEDRAQLDFLRLQGCELAQGQLWDTPVEAAEVPLTQPPGAHLP
jgi:diguanylate cyclase (GGDEF)-like protein/PAS domain S-box-containing protein